LGSRASNGPVMVVSYVSSTCMACVTHLVELEGAMPRFCKRGAEVWVVCADSLSGFRIPLRASVSSDEWHKLRRNVLA
jgi:hypothetical protein